MEKINKVVSILMSRDGLTRDEAEAVLESVRRDIDIVMEDGDYTAVEDIVYAELGLEMDYIFDILGM